MDEGERDQLVSLAARGDHDALEQLLVLSSGGLSGHLRGRIPQAMRAIVEPEDVLQQAYVVAFQKIDTLQNVHWNGFQAWLRKVAENRLSHMVEALQAARRGGGRRRLLAGTPQASSVQDLIAEISGRTDSPSRAMRLDEAEHALQVALATLPDDQARALRLRYLEGCSLPEVAEALGRTEPAVRGLLHRGKQQLEVAMGRASRWLSER